jgi:hypothetical protein
LRTSCFFLPAAFAKSDAEFCELVKVHSKIFKKFLPQ